jgi:hypothetical protein
MAATLLQELHGIKAEELFLCYAQGKGNAP